MQLSRCVESVQLFPGRGLPSLPTGNVIGKGLDQAQGNPSAHRRRPRRRMEQALFAQRLNAMVKRAVPPTATDKEVRVLLERYHCPVPFHEVRARFLGNIATPTIGASPIKMVERLWGGELPEFNSVDAANELVGALIMGLWDRLTQHQERSVPFRVMRRDVMATRECLATLAMIRCQELDGFVEGLFGEEETIDLPERAHRGLDTLSEMRALMAAVLHMARDETKAVSNQDIQTSLRNVREMTKIAEHEIHAIVLSCARSRRQMLAVLPATKPTLH